MQLLLGMTRMIAIIECIPAPVIVGFAIIWVDQWKDFFGLPANRYTGSMPAI